MARSRARTSDVPCDQRTPSRFLDRDHHRGPASITPTSDAAHLVNDTSAAIAPRATTLRYLPGLDGLRAISVLAVLVFHHYFLFGAQRGWLPGGFLGVEVFFVVS